MPDYIPSNPVVDFAASRDARKLAFPPPGVFSVARHAMIAYLRYLSEVRRKPTATVLIPDYMCHEVVTALAEAGFRLRRYALDENLDASASDLDAAAGDGVDAVVLTHFYGRVARRLPEIAAWCRRRGAALIEDCVHLPYPFHAEFPAGGDPSSLSDARVFTFRKVYPVPLGAAIVLRECQADFARFVDAKVGRRYPDEGLDYWKWAAKQMVKKSLLAAGLGYKQSYRDLSEDPLKPYNFLPARFDRLLTRTHFERAVARRRENAARYAGFRPFTEASWGRPLEFAATDVPYMYVVFLNEGLEALPTVKRLMARGIPAVLGLALDEDFLKTLPADHRYRRVLSLPLHQDIREQDIDYIGQILALGKDA